MGERTTVADVTADVQQLRADNDEAHERLAREAAEAEARLLERVDGIEPRVAALEADAAKIEPLDLTRLSVALLDLEGGLSTPGLVVIRPEEALEAVRGAQAVVKYLDAVWTAEDALEEAHAKLPTAAQRPVTVRRKGTASMFSPDVLFTSLGDDLKPAGEPALAQATIEFGEQPKADANLDG